MQILLLLHGAFDSIYGSYCISSTQVEGVKRMLGYVRDRVDTLSRECHAHRALAAKRQQLVSTCEDLIDKVHTSLRLCPKWHSLFPR